MVVSGTELTPGAQRGLAVDRRLAELDRRLASLSKRVDQLAADVDAYCAKTPQEQLADVIEAEAQEPMPR